MALPRVATGAVDLSVSNTILRARAQTRYDNYSCRPVFLDKQTSQIKPASHKIGVKRPPLLL